MMFGTDSETIRKQSRDSTDGLGEIVRLSALRKLVTVSRLRGLTWEGPSQCRPHMLHVLRSLRSEKKELRDASQEVTRKHVGPFTRCSTKESCLLVHCVGIVETNTCCLFFFAESASAFASGSSMVIFNAMLKKERESERERERARTTTSQTPLNHLKTRLPRLDSTWAPPSPRAQGGARSADWA